MSITKQCCAFFIVALAVSSSACWGQEYGEQVVSNGTEIYFTEGVTEEEAEKLGLFLTEYEFSDGTEKSVQLTKEDDVWQFRMVVMPEFVEDKEMHKNFKFMCLELSTAFEGKQVDVQICDDELKTLKVFKGLFGNLSEVDSAEFYQAGVTDEQAKSVKLALRKLGMTENPATYHLLKLDDKYQLRMVIIEEFYNDEEILQEVKGMATTISDECLDGAVLEFHLCNEYLESQNSVTTDEQR